MTLLLSSDVTLRLTIHAAALRVDRSTLVEGLLRAHLSRFVLQDRGGGALGADRQGTAVV